MKTSYRQFLFYLTSMSKILIFLQLNDNYRTILCVITEVWTDLETSCFKWLKVTLWNHGTIMATVIVSWSYLQIFKTIPGIKLKVSIILWQVVITISTIALREKCPYLEFFWSIFNPNAANMDQENSEYGQFLRSDMISS